MRFFKTFILFLFSMGLMIIMSCSNDDGGPKITGQLRIVTSTSGNITNPSGMYGVTFTGLAGEDIGSEIGSFEMGYNEDTLVEFNRVGELLTVILYNVPTNCSKPGQLHFDSLFNAVLIPLDGSVKETTFTVECN